SVALLRRVASPDNRRYFSYYVHPFLSHIVKEINVPINIIGIIHHASMSQIGAVTIPKYTIVAKKAPQRAATTNHTRDIASMTPHKV
ncbi:MAG: hypothetical protein ACXVI5_06215, partial [Halobacteriota archaeon]